MIERVVCRNCGEVHLVNTPPTPGTWQPTERQQVATGATMPGAAVEYERMTPVRPAQISSEVGVPALTALIVALPLGGLFTMACTYWEISGWVAVVGALLAFLLTFGLVAGYLRGTLVTSEFHRTEPAPVATEQPPAVKRVRLQVDDGKRRQYADLPLDLAELQATARAVQAGRPFSVASLTGRGHPLSRSQFETLRDWLLAGGYLVWVDASNRQAGVRFTARGEALIRGLAE